MAKETYCSYMMHLRLKITYPLPSTTPTQQQCRFLQAPVLEALLCFQDKVAQLKLILLLHYQIHVCIPHHFYHLPFSQYARLVDHPWLALVWQFLAQAKIKLHIE
jgi:hypothetical protein